MVDIKRPEGLLHCTTRLGTPRSHQDRSPGKRKTDGPEHFSLDQAAREELLEFQGEYHEELLSCSGTGFECWNLKWCLEIESLATLKSNSQTT